MTLTAIIATVLRSDWFGGCTGLAVLVWALVPAAGCQSAEQQRKQLSSPDAVGRVRAAVWLAETGDSEALHRLVGLLEDRDRAVRMYAILALQRLTGQTYNYRYYASEPQRRRAVLRWQEALRRGELRVRAAGHAGASAERPADVTAGGYRSNGPQVGRAAQEAEAP